LAETKFGCFNRKQIQSSDNQALNCLENEIKKLKRRIYLIAEMDI